MAAGLRSTTWTSRPFTRASSRVSQNRARLPLRYGITSVCFASVMMALSDVGWNDGLHHSCLCSSDAVRLPLAASGLKNTFGQLAGFAAPIVLGLLTPYPDGLSREQFELQGTEPPEAWVTEMLFEWRSVFLLAAVIDSVGLLAYFAMGSGEPLHS